MDQERSLHPRGQEVDIVSSAVPMVSQVRMPTPHAGIGQRPAPHEPGHTITMSFVIRSMLRWWKVATPVGMVLAAASAAAVWYTFEPLYRASAWIQIDDNTPYIAFQTRDESRRFVDTQLELLRSPLVLGPVLARPEIGSLPELRRAEDPIQWLTGKLRVNAVGRSELFQITYDGPNPKNAANLVNCVVDSYFELRGQNDRARAQRVIELLEEEKERRAREVERQRETVRQLSKQIVGKDPFTGIPTADVVVMSHPLDSMQQRLTSTEVDAKLLEAQVKAYSEAIANSEIEVPASMLDMAVENSNEVQGLQAQLASKRALMVGTENASAQGKNDPAYKRLINDIARIDSDLEAARKALRPRLEQEMATQASLQRKQELEELKGRLESHKLLEKFLREQYAEQLRNAENSGGQSLDLEFARAELAREEKVFELIAQRALALRTENRAPARISLTKRADPPSVPVEPIPYKHLAAAVAVSLFLPFGIAVVWERSVRRIGSAQQLEEQADVHVIAEVARLPLRARTAGRGSSRAIGRDLGVFEESIDGLRTCLVLSEDRRDVQVLAVTSAVPGEGKTSVASQLAVSIARASGQPTLIIDGDMRSPDVDRIFQVPIDPGLSKVLDQQCGLDEALVTNWSQYVHLLPAGQLHKNPHKLLGSGAFKELLDQARQKYRFIVIDTPPILSASESLVMAKEADGALICAMRDYSRGRQVRLAYERLVAAGARPIGTVLNGVPARQYAYNYGRYAYQTQSW